MIPIELRERILHAVEEHQAEIIGFAQRLIQIESVTGHEGAIQTFMADSLREMGLVVDQFVPDLEALRSHPSFVPLEGLDFAGRPNVVGIYRGSGGGRSLLFNGHVDTIPLGPTDAWTHGPLSGTVADGRVFGRGASDMKGGLAAMTMAVKILLQADIRLRGDILLEYVVDEEMTGYGTLACILRGYRADAGISLETSDLCIQPACIGRLWFTVTLKGKAVSISRRWEGVSAIEKGIKIFQAIQDLEQMRWEDLRHPLYEDHRTALPCAVCMFHAGIFPSAVPDSAILRGSLGLMPQEDRKDVERQVVEQLMRVAQADAWLRHHPPVVEFKKTGGEGAEIPSDHPIVCTVRTAFQTITGTSPTISGRTGGADTRYLIKHGQTPTVIFGPGMTSEMHAIDESVPIGNLVFAVKTLALTIAEWSGVDGAISH
jgi:acetylornithine deacetylase